MYIIHYFLSISPRTAKQSYQENRIIYTVSFVIGCGWLTLLFLSQRFRNANRWLPGGLKTMIVLSLAIIGISAYLLH